MEVFLTLKIMTEREVKNNDGREKDVRKNNNR